MSGITLIIKGTAITLPASASSPNWAPAIIAAFRALTDAVNSVTGTYDVAAQVQNIDANNSSTDVTIDSLQFPVTDVRSVVVYYSVFRTTEDSGPPDGESVAEGGTITVVYNPENPVNNKWEIAQQKVGDAQITFTITDTGQFQFSTTPLTGINHTGILTFRAISVLNT
jgi:hypothetical protein